MRCLIPFLPLFTYMLIHSYHFSHSEILSRMPQLLHICNKLHQLPSFDLFNVRFIRRFIYSLTLSNRISFCFWNNMKWAFKWILDIHEHKKNEHFWKIEFCLNIFKWINKTVYNLFDFFILIYPILYGLLS